MNPRIILFQSEEYQTTILTTKFLNESLRIPMTYKIKKLKIKIKNLFFPFLSSVALAEEEYPQPVCFPNLI